MKHRAIPGEDDPATLKTLYEELEGVSMRLYSGLDDKTLDLLDEVSVPSLAEANLDFATVHRVPAGREGGRGEGVRGRAEGRCG
ncbi:hypothetical protein [Streptomyces sp. CC219B]|uniref:hypothetical protein n=1 Tax=Streptomyces sp. CC219B TaxID=3044574 RepID=UPI0024A8DCD0|nr:hypothetical protein [Streptomyces sp. CC219B]